jgi:hypothetical protein
MCNDIIHEAYDHYCGVDCDKFGGSRQCPSGVPVQPSIPAGLCTPSPPAPPAPPPQPPNPPAPPFVVEWQQFFIVLLPAGANCKWEYYLQRDQFTYLATVQEGDCANHCLQYPSCTGFESPFDDSYCHLWLNGACNSTASLGLLPPGTFPTSGEGSYFTYVRKQGASQLPILRNTLIGGGFGLTIAILIVKWRFKSLRKRHVGLIQQAQEIEMGRLSGYSKDELEGCMREALHSNPELRNAMLKDAQKRKTKGPPKAASGGNKTLRFSASLQELVFGKQADSVLGIGHLMRVPDALLHTAMSGGVSAIVSELEKAGTAVDQECLDYVLRQRAGSSPRVFDNSPFPRDCDKNGFVRSDRTTATGEGMMLADFVAHAHSQTAELGEAHVLALRLYTSAAFASLNKPLRELASGARSEPHPFPVTTAFIADAIKKLRAVAASEGSEEDSRSSDKSTIAPAHLVLWRGLKNIVPITGNEPFFTLGGTELAPMSTTVSLAVALSYGHSTSSVLLRLCPSSFMQAAADLSFLSVFPAEKERVYPPLTYLEPQGRPIEVSVDLDPSHSVTYTVVNVLPHMG